MESCLAVGRCALRSNSIFWLPPASCDICQTRKIRSYQPWLWLILALPLLNRIAVWKYETGYFFGSSSLVFANIYYKFNTHCDGLIMGMIISKSLDQLGQQSIVRSARTGPPSSVFAGFALLVLAQQVQHQVLIFSGLAFFFGSLVWFGLHWKVALLQFAPVLLGFPAFLRHVSQPCVFGALDQRPCLAALAVARRYHANSRVFFMLSVMSALIALVTFSLVEHPFLELRSRWLASEKA